ncbi:MAG: ABC transporter permease [Chloroflexota bacterium]|nr:ABC transporter permease [Chloroflexota bacterium]
MEGCATLGSAARRPTSVLARWYRFTLRWPVFPGFVLSLLVLVGIFAPWIAPHSPTQASLLDRITPPAWYAEGSSKYILGADHQGRDVLSRLVYGARITLLVASTVIVAAGVLGMTLGMLAGYIGGIVDELIMRGVDVILTLPLLLVALVFVIAFGQSIFLLVGLLAVFSWGNFARQVRGEVLQLRTMDYVALSKVAGAPTMWTIYKHILPGVTSTVTIVASVAAGGVIMTEATLSFLGAGVPPPTPSWGSMVSEGRLYLTSAWWIAFFPGLAIFLVVMSLFFFADWVRDRLDPRLRQLM